jgi:ferredoxin
MAYIIAETCLSCGACEPVCPDKAISEKRGLYAIDFKKCTECVGAFDSPHCAEVCSIAAPGPDPEHKENRQQLLSKWKRLHASQQSK